MLTRIEIDGFKTFREFALDLPPFMVLLGPNGAGKSNLFDALRFLSRLVSDPVLEAAQDARGDLLELFHHDSEGRRSDRIRFAVEVLLDDAVTDAFGETSELPTTRVRYELTIELRSVPTGLRPFVTHERPRTGADGRSVDRPVRPAGRPIGPGRAGHRRRLPGYRGLRPKTRQIPHLARRPPAARSA